MFAFPFIYFLLLCIWMYRRHHSMDVACYLCLIYAVSAFFSIVAVWLNCWDEGGLCPEHPIGIFPTLIYCGLLTITIMPFYKMDTLSIEHFVVPENKKWMLEILGWASIITFIISVYCFLPDIKDVLTSNLKDVRNSIYGDAAESLTGIRYYLALPSTLIGPLSPVFIFLFYYNISFGKRRPIYNVALLISSMTPILGAIKIAGRTQPVYWVLSLILGYVFFRSYMTKSQRLWIKVPIISILAVLVLYMGVVSIARYGDEREMIIPLVSYAGQSYLNFCYFFDLYNDSIFSLVRLFPFTHFFFIEPSFDLFQYRDAVYAASNMNIGIFYTFLGDLMVDLTHIGMCVYVLIYAFCANHFLKRENIKEMDFYQIFIFLILVLIPLQGVFYYSYYTVKVAYFYICSALLACYFNFKYRPKE